ncbi:hypothetical protein [Moorena producens]
MIVNQYLLLCQAKKGSVGISEVLGAIAFRPRYANALNNLTNPSILIPN